MKKEFFLLFYFIFAFSSLVYCQNKEEKENHKRPFLIKVTPLAFPLGYTALGFETPIKDRLNLDIKLGRIGWGKKIFDQGKGGFLNIGLKRIFKTEYTKPFGGFYLRPELMVGRYDVFFNHYVYEQDKPRTITPKKIQVTYLSAIPNFGFQFYLGKRILMDFSLGVTPLAYVYNKSEELGRISDNTHYGMLILSKANSVRNKWQRGNGFKTGLFLAYNF
jgi:hypothetical protein